VPEPAASRVAWSGRYLSVDIETWPELGDYEVVRKHDAVAVVPVTPASDVLLVKQFRPPVRTSLLEVPAGLLDVEGEDALTCAERELLEETGFRSVQTEFLGGSFLSPGFTAEYVHLFWARTAAAPHGAPETGIEVVPTPFARAVAAARDGKVRNAMTALALLLAAEVPALRDAATSPS
jgi:8-oxo-dGTP pyrophosphatase MutT (NUDIX family)